MLFRIGLENNIERRSLVWALEHPGCFAYGANGEEALESLPAAIERYRNWVEQHEPGSWLSPGDFEIHLEETWATYRIDENYEPAEDGYEVNAWFRHDWKPLTALEVERGQKLLSWSRAELLGTVKDLTLDALDAPPRPGERWSIAGILKHVGGAEWWYLSRLGRAFNREDVPDDPLERLAVVRSFLLQELSGLVGIVQVEGIEGEFWSPRKLLRRAVWHELDHRNHIRKLLSS